MKMKTRNHLLLATALLSFWSFGIKAQTYKNINEISVSVKEAKMRGDTVLATSTAQNYINSFLFKQKKKILFSKESLEFMAEYLGNTNSIAFKLFLQNKEKINAVLGENKAEYAIRLIIDLDYLPRHSIWKTNKPDWDRLEKTVTTEFGSIGQEEVQGKRMVYYQEMSDWINFSKYYKLYFEKAMKRPEYIINSLSWDIFLHGEDPQVLAFAGDVMKYALEMYYDYNPGAIDTYANLLYKTGRRADAIQWELKAVKAFPTNREFRDNLEKMKGNLTAL